MTLGMTGQTTNPNNPNVPVTVQTNIVQSDATEKLFLLYKKYGVGTYGDAIVNNLPIGHYIEQFQAQHAVVPQNTQALANDLLAYFRTIQPIPKIGIMLTGYDGQDPWVVTVDVNGGIAKRGNVDSQNNIQYGIGRGGDTPIVDRLLSQQQFNPLFNVMSLQDAIDFSRHLIRTTIDQMRFEPRFPTVGGPIDTLVVTRHESKFLIQKSLIAH